MFADVDSDNFSRPSFSHFDCLVAITAAKVDHNFIFRLFPNPLAEQLFQFADTTIRTAVAITRLSVGTEPAKQAVPKSSPNHTHRNSSPSRCEDTFISSFQTAGHVFPVNKSS